MALVEVGEFFLRMGTGPQNVPLHDGSFTPSAILFFAEDRANFANRGFQAFGFSDGTSHFGTAVSIGGFGTEHFWADDNCIVGGITTFAFELRLAAHVTSLNAGSFDLQFDINAVGGNRWIYVAFNSATISAKAFSVDDGGSFPKTQNLAFQPQVAIGQWHHGAAGGTFSGPGGGPPTFGWGSSCAPTKQTGLANNIYTTYQHQGKFLTRINDAGVIGQEIEVTTYGATSLTFAHSSVGTGEYFSVLALGGGTFSANVDVFAQGDTPIPILSSNPVFVLAASNCQATSAAAVNGLRAALGACDGTRQESIWIGATDNNTADSRQTSTKLITLATPNGTPGSTIDGQAAWTSFAAQQVNLAWNIDDGIDRAGFYLTIATDVGTGPDFCGGGASCVSPTLTSMTLDCDTSIVTITGSNIDTGATVELRDPSNNIVPITIISITSTQIVFSATLTTNGTYCATVTNPPLNAEAPCPSTICADFTCGTPPPPSPCAPGPPSVPADPVGPIGNGSAVSGESGVIVE